jgi:putative PIN family toxin of toxin-antitoxin system
LIAVLDPNVIISALLTPEGSPARVLRLWLEGGFDLVVSPAVLDELAGALAYPKLQKRISPAEAEEAVELISRWAMLVGDPVDPPSVRSTDPSDDYLIALAESSRAVLVSGDRDLLSLSDRIPVYSPTDFLELL